MLLNLQCGSMTLARVAGGTANDLAERQFSLGSDGCESQLRSIARHPTVLNPEFLRWSVGMLWTIFAILLLLWLLGWGFHVAGSLIHLLLVVAVVVLLIELITGRRAAI